MDVRRRSRKRMSGTYTVQCCLRGTILPRASAGLPVYTVVVIQRNKEADSRRWSERESGIATERRSIDETQRAITHWIVSEIIFQLLSPSSGVCVFCNIWLIIILQGVPQPLGRSYSFVQQQKQQQKLMQQQLHQQQQQQQVRRRERDDDAMHERYLMISQTHEQSRQRLSSNTSSSNSSNSSSNSAAGEEIEGHAEGDDGKKKRSNGNPSPPPSPYYGNLLTDADHLLPLQHYILQQAKLSGKAENFNTDSFRFCFLLFIFFFL